MSRKRAIFATACLALVLAGWTTAARADATITLNEAAIARKLPMRSGDQNPLWISRDDCLGNDELTLPLNVTGYAGLGLEAWVGDKNSDCRDVAARSAATGTCWQVYVGSVLSSPTTVVVRARDIVGRHLPPASPGSGTEQDCVAQGPSDGLPVQVQLYLMFIDLADGTQKGGLGWNTAYDLVPPHAPVYQGVNLSTNPVQVSWQPPSDSDLWGFGLFCDPMPGDESAVASGAGSCGSTKLQAGGTGPSDALCSLVHGATATSAGVPGLQPGHSYSVAVSAMDSVGNRSELSTVACATPPQVPDSAGADGGGCSLQAGRAPGRYGLVGLGIALALMLMQRKRASQ